MTLSLSALRAAFPRACAVLALAAIAACDDGVGPVAAVPEPEDRPELAQIRCRASVREGTVECGAAAALPGDARGMILGGQGQYVRLLSTAPAYTAADSIFLFGVNVRNLIPQPLGTQDGTTPMDGVFLFFQQAPTVTAGTGAVRVVNADGTGAFTGGEQIFYRYWSGLLGPDGILSPNELSGRRAWRFRVDPTVERFEFVLLVAAEVPHPDGWIEVKAARDTVLPGDTVRMTAVVRSAVGTILPDPVTWGFDPEVGTVDAAGLLTVTGPGTTTVSANSGPRYGWTEVRVCLDSEVGQVNTLNVFAAREVCMNGGAAGAEYTFVDGNSSSPGNEFTNLVASSGIVPVTGPPSPDAASARAAETGLLAGPAVEREITAGIHAEAVRAASARPGPAGSAGARRAIAPGVPSVGDRMVLYASRSCNAVGQERVARVMAVTDHAVVVADSANPTGGFTQAQYETIGRRFDQVVHQPVTAAFGVPGDLDGNGRTILFYTRKVNELTAPGSAGLVDGFFAKIDLLPADFRCPSSNYGEVLSLPVPDPTGAINGNVYSTSQITLLTTRAQAHHFSHLVNASLRPNARTAINAPYSWLDEALSAVAEELAFYAASGLGSRANLGPSEVLAGGTATSAFYELQASNLRRFRSFLANPERSSPLVGASQGESLGATWHFVRYLADRSGEPDNVFWKRLMVDPAAPFTTYTDFDRLEIGLGLEADEQDTQVYALLRDWTMAVYADDVADGVPARFQLSSWNLRALFTSPSMGQGLGGGYPLAVRNPADGVTEQVKVVSAGAAYLRVGAAAGTRPFVRFTSDSGFPMPPWHPVQVIRRR